MKYRQTDRQTEEGDWDIWIFNNFFPLSAKVGIRGWGEREGDWNPQREGGVGWGGVGWSGVEEIEK